MLKQHCLGIIAHIILRRYFKYRKTSTRFKVSVEKELRINFIPPKMKATYILVILILVGVVSGKVSSIRIFFPKSLSLDENMLEAN